MLSDILAEQFDRKVVHRPEAEGTEEYNCKAALELESFVLAQSKAQPSRPNFSTCSFMQAKSNDQALQITEHVVRTVEERGVIRVNRADRPLSFSANLIRTVAPFGSVDERAFAPEPGRYEEGKLLAWNVGEPKHYRRAFKLFVDAQGVDTRKWGHPSEAKAGKQVAGFFNSRLAPHTDKPTLDRLCTSYRYRWTTGLEAISQKNSKKRKAH